MAKVVKHNPYRSSYIYTPEELRELIIKKQIQECLNAISDVMDNEILIKTHYRVGISGGVSKEASEEVEKILREKGWKDVEMRKSVKEGLPHLQIILKINN